MKNRVRPTEKQLKALEIKKANPKMPLGKAMEKAGYSKGTSRSPKQNLLELKGTEVAIEKYRNELAGLGLTGVKLAQKLKEWIDAKKIHSSHTEPDRMIPDYQTQIKAGEMLRQDLGIAKDKEALGLAFSDGSNEIKVVVTRGEENGN